MNVTIQRRAFAKLLVAIGASAAAAPAFAQAKTVEVSMKLASFSPPTVNVSAGDTVHWTNEAVVTHTATFDPSMAATAGNVALPAGVAPFDSGDLEEDGTFSHTFTVKGTYKYVCKYHEAMGMVGTVVVT
jgi:plastocyanin